MKPLSEVVPHLWGIQIQIQVVPLDSWMMLLYPIPFLNEKRCHFMTFFMTTWERENKSERKKEPQILRPIGLWTLIGPFGYSHLFEFQWSQLSRNMLFFCKINWINIFLICQEKLKFLSFRQLNPLKKCTIRSKSVKTLLYYWSITDNDRSCNFHNRPKQNNRLW